MALRSTLAVCGLRPGCALQLHSLAPSTPTSSSDEPVVDAEAPLPLSEEGVFRTLDSRVTPRDYHRGAHSFAGVIWDVSARSDREVVITSLHVAGMLGHVRVFARDTNWQGDDEDEHRRRTVYTGWGSRYNMATDRWRLVFEDRAVTPSWNATRELRLQEPVRILPHHTRALFVHSALPDDLGIQYQARLVALHAALAAVH